MFWSKLCKSSWNCAWNLAFPEFISPIVWNMCEHLHYEIGIFQRATQRARILLPDNIQNGGSCSVNHYQFKEKITVSFCFSERTETLTPFHYVRNRWRNNDDSNFYTRYYEYRGKFSCLCCHNKTSRYEVPIRDGALFFCKVVGRGWGGRMRNYPLQTLFLNIYVSANIFSPSSSFCKHFFSTFFSVLFICAEYYHCLIWKLFFEEPNR